MFENNQPLPLIGSTIAGAVIGWIIGRANNQPQSKQLLNKNSQWMTETDLCVAGGLMAAGYGHLFSFWPAPGLRDEIKKRFLFAMMAEMKRVSCQLEPLRLSILRPPTPQSNPTYLEIHGEVRIDSYHWLRDHKRSDPKVLSYLTEENNYFAAVMADTNILRQQLYTEMKDRTQEDDTSAPLRFDGYYYYTKTIKGKQHRLHCRRKVGSSNEAPSINEEMDLSIPEEILLDENIELAKHPYGSIEGVKLSPSGRYLAYFIDKRSNHRFILRIKDLKRRKVLTKEEIKNVFPSCEWMNDSSAVLYIGMCEKMRPSQARRHILGRSTKEDLLLYTELDHAFRLSLTKTRDLSKICLISSSLMTNEWRVLNAVDLEDRFALVLRREHGVEYWLERHFQSLFFRVRDKKRPNCELFIAPVENPNDQTVLIPHQKAREITNFVVGQNHITVFYKKEMFHTLEVYNLPDNSRAIKKLSHPVEVQLEDKLYGLVPGSQGTFDSPVLRFIYTSLTTPDSIMNQDLRNFERRLAKMAPVLGGFDEAKYASDRKYAVAEDGTEIPISLVYRSDLNLQTGSNPVLLHVYGSYGTSLDLTFSNARLSLLDRGFIIAHAHVRGGGDLGRDWHDQGKLLQKLTSHEDTITCANYLIEKEYCNPTTLCIHGCGAGGTTVAAVVNRRPDLFRAVILETPLLDILTSMSDTTLPMAREELEEWGDPRNEDYYNYIKRYSPLDNFCRKPYPHMLLTTALNDSRIGYWEAAKFTAKLRKHKTDSNLLLLKNDLQGGSSSNATTPAKFKELSFQYAFLIKALGTPVMASRS